jgi:hypothetical protein
MEIFESNVIFEIFLDFALISLSGFTHPQMFLNALQEQWEPLL